MYIGVRRHYIYSLLLSDQKHNQALILFLLWERRLRIAGYLMKQGRVSFLSIIPADKLRRNDRLSPFAPPNEQRKALLKRNHRPKLVSLRVSPKPELNT